MTYRLHLTLPRTRASVPIARHLARAVLGELGVAPECGSDIELALTEACTNVLLHAGDGVDQYEVSIEVDLAVPLCRIEVLDAGGFDRAVLSFHAAALLAEGGRGLHLIDALTDEVRFASGPGGGTRVVMLKRLELESQVTGGGYRGAGQRHRFTAELRRLRAAPN
jgi:serine/threonine-protein kinase RsbW